MKSVLIYSGGLDSTVLLFDLIRQGHDVHCLSIDYGQRHGRELASASSIARWAKVPYRCLSLYQLKDLLAGSSQTSNSIEVPEGHYEEESMKLTVVPNRNMIMLSVAIGWAISIDAHSVYYAAHSGDHAIYPDCRREFVTALSAVSRLCHFTPVELKAPYLKYSKAQLVELGKELKVPFDQTWSCYKGGKLHCGKCGTCVERREAFHLAQTSDPTEYEDVG